MFKRATSSSDALDFCSGRRAHNLRRGPGVIWHGAISGSGGVRIEGAFEGEIALRGLLVVGETGRVTC